MKAVIGIASVAVSLAAIATYVFGQGTHTSLSSQPLLLLAALLLIMGVVFLFEFIKNSKKNKAVGESGRA